MDVIESDFSDLGNVTARKKDLNQNEIEQKLNLIINSKISALTERAIRKLVPKETWRKLTAREEKEFKSLNEVNHDYTKISDESNETIIIY